MIEKIKQDIKDIIISHTNHDDIMVEVPKKGDADLSVPLFSFSKQQKVSPLIIFNMFAPLINEHPYIESTQFLNGFLNIYLKRSVISNIILEDVLNQNELYGQLNDGQGKTVVMDYSSPNIAKNFSIGHLRSTMIGNALKNIYKKAGYHVVSVNHLGDWGTQFGKMIVAYQKWGSKEDIEKDPINELQKLYVKFHDEEKNDETLEQQGRDAFLKLEQNDIEYIKLWTYFKDESLKEFMKMYDVLNVKFDSYAGESFYNDKMDAVVAELEEKNLLKLDDGATIVDLGQDMPPALIKRSDGATLYMTRDLAALLYRYQTYSFSKILYVVGNEQKFHFAQLKIVSQLMGYDFDIEHINFGLVLVDGKKMSTRKGKYTSLESVINQSVEVAKSQIEEKNPSLDQKDFVAKAVGIGAIIFNDLKNEKHLDIEFNLENMLKFEGQTGPYLQYSGVRIKSILRSTHIDFNKANFDCFKEEHYFDMIKLIAQFPHIIRRSLEQNAPNIISRYILNLAQGFNSFYGKERILVDEEGQKHANLSLIKAIQVTLDQGLKLLGMIPLEYM